MTSDFEISRADPDEWRTVRDVRLRALKDAPEAFGSTYEREQAFTQPDWTRRLASDRSVTFLARFRGRVVGIVGGVQRDHGAELVAMWVEPEVRGRGGSSQLVDAVIAWASAIGAPDVHLWVTVGNDQAYRLYERCGFTPTGERKPMPSHPDLDEISLQRNLP